VTIFRYRPLTRRLDPFDAYTLALDPAVHDIARALIWTVEASAPDLIAVMVGGHPAWTTRRTLGRPAVCSLWAGAGTMTLTFSSGAEIADPTGRLQPSGDGSAFALFERLDHVDAAVIAEWLRQDRVITQQRRSRDESTLPARFGNTERPVDLNPLRPTHRRRRPLIGAN
jgi:hypothetical protein